MKAKSLFLSLLPVLLLTNFLAPEANGQDKFILSGEIRERGVYSHGYKGLLAPDEHGTFWVGQRTRLNFDYRHNDLGFFVQLEDGRIWGSTTGAHTTGFGIGQAYFFMEFAKRFGFKVGRMALQYENGRYLSYSAWDECPRTHDALIFNFRSLDKKTKVDIGASVSNNSSNTILNPYSLNNYFKYLLFGYVSHQFLPDLRWSVLSVTDFQERRYADSSGDIRTDPTRLYARSTIGSYLELFSTKKVSALIYGYGQFGKHNDGTAVAAGLFSTELKCRILPVFDIVLAYDYISGSDFAGNGTDHSFDRFLGSAHAFLGIMDFFTCSGPEDINLGRGYHQPSLTLNYRPAEKHSLSLNARYFLTEKQIFKGAENVEPNISLPDLNRDLGFEMALRYKYKIRSDLSLEAGYAFHTATKTLEYLSGIESGTSKFAHFGYVMMAYKPTLYNSANHPRKEK